MTLLPTHGNNSVICAGRDFAEVLSVVSDPQHSRVVAVTSPERAQAAEKEKPGFFDSTINVL